MTQNDQQALPTIVAQEEWEAARETLLVKERPQPTPATR